MSSGGRKINSKYIYQNKLPKRKIKARQKRRLTSFSNIRKTNKNNSKVKNSLLQPWLNRWLLIVIGLFVVIICIPVIIVAPFLQDPPSSPINAKDSSISLPPTTESEIAVSVMRAETKKIEDVPLETYVARVIASEMPIEFNIEALKAQGIAARTYIVNHMLHQQETNISDTTDHQVYKNEHELKELFGDEFEQKMGKLIKAVTATEGEILTYDGYPIDAAYFSTSNGFTENSEDYWEDEIPYLRSVESPWDKDSPMYLDQKILSVKEISQKLQIPLHEEQKISIHINQTKSGRVKDIHLNDHSFTGREIREKLNLKSSDFSIEQQEGHFIFTTKGYGHGVGMSQYGANGMAKEGKSYQEIINHYYQDVEIKNVEDITQTLLNE